MEGKIACIPPNANLYDFSGTIEVMGKRLMMGPKQFLLRGSKLKNTKWVIGIVCYTGIDTKIMKNADAPKYKQSNIERMVNILTLLILILQTFLCLICAFGAMIWDIKYIDENWYISKP